MKRIKNIVFLSLVAVYLVIVIGFHKQQGKIAACEHCENPDC